MLKQILQNLTCTFKQIFTSNLEQDNAYQNMNGLLLIQVINQRDSSDPVPRS